MTRSIVYQRFETAATISWLLMDYCWMVNYMALAWVFSLWALLLSVGALIYYKDNIWNERLLLFASLSWVVMNCTCLWGESCNLTSLLFTSKVFFVITLLLVISAVFVSRKKKEKIDFKRLKIK